MNSGGNTLQLTTDVVHMPCRNSETRCKKMPHFYGSEITAVTILELFLMEKNLKVRQNEYAVLYLYLMSSF